MAHSLCLQKWISLGGKNVTLIQDEAAWLDVGSYQGIAVYTELGFITNNTFVTKVQVQTSPTREAAMFGAGTGSGGCMVEYSFSGSSSFGVQPVSIVRWSDSEISGAPLSRYLRWQTIFPNSEIALTFRMWLSVLATRSC